MGGEDGDFDSGVGCYRKLRTPLPFFLLRSYSEVWRTMKVVNSSDRAGGLVREGSILIFGLGYSDWKGCKKRKEKERRDISSLHFLVPNKC